MSTVRSSFLENSRWGMWRAHGLVRKADLILALLLLGASSSLQSDSMQIASRTLCCRPLPAFSPFFFLSRANQSPLERLPCSGLANNIKPRGMDLAKSPSSVVDDRAPLPPRCQSQLPPWMGVASSFPGGSYIRFPLRRCRSPSAHTATRRDRSYSKIGSPRIRN